MKNEHGIEFAALYGDILIATYPNPKIFPVGSPGQDDRSKELFITSKPVTELKSGLLMPGGPRRGKVYK